MKPSAKKWRKNLYFQCIVEMKQPDTMAEPNFLGSATVSGCFISDLQ